MSCTLVSGDFKQANMTSLFTVNVCCFYADLKTGSLIIGYFHLAINIVLPLIIIFNLGTVWEILGVKINPDDNTILISFLCLFLMVLFVSLFYNIVFLVGVHNNKPGYVKSYLVFSSLMVVLTCIIYLNGLVKRISPQLTVAALLTLFLQLYFLLITRCYYLKMEKPERGQALFNNP